MASIQGCTHGDEGPERSMTARIEVSFDYLLYLPDGYEQDESVRWPLLVFLHGSGERGDDLSLVRIHGPPKEIGNGMKLPFIVVAPQCPEGIWWRPMEIRALVDAIVAEHRVDKERIYLSGLSMGGFGTWATAAEYPGLFAAIVPVCGGGERWMGKRLAGIPVWAFHGEADEVVPVERTEGMVDAIEAAGGEARFTRYPGVGHDSWTATYANPDLYAWLLQQRLAKARPR